MSYTQIIQRKRLINDGSIANINPQKVENDEHLSVWEIFLA
jgi:hypothetical protein